MVTGGPLMGGSNRVGPLRNSPPNQSQSTDKKIKDWVKKRTTSFDPLPSVEKLKALLKSCDPTHKDLGVRDHKGTQMTFIDYMLNIAIKTKGKTGNRADNKKNLILSIINKLFPPGTTATHFAAENGHTGVVELLLTHAKSTLNEQAFEEFLNVTDGDECTALHRAAFYGHTEIVKLLLADGAEGGARSPGIGTPLMLAAEKGHMGVVQLLLDNHVLMNETNSSHQTALSLARLGEHTEVEALLLSRGALDLLSRGAWDF